MSIVFEMAFGTAFLALSVLLATEQPTASGRYSPLPEGDGLAARYPGDVGIEQAPEVVFADGFEGIEDDAIVTGSAEQKGKKWDSAWRTVRVTREPENVHSGTKAVEIRHEEPTSHGVEKEFKEGFDSLHVRYYMKFHKEFPGCHHTGILMWARAPDVTLGSGSAPSPRQDKDGRTTAALEAFVRPSARPVEHLLLSHGSGAQMGRPVLPLRRGVPS